MHLKPPASLLPSWKRVKKNSKMKKKPPTNVDSVGKLHFHKMGKYVVGQRHETLSCLKTNQTNALIISKEAEQMIRPLKQT